MVLSPKDYERHTSTARHAVEFEAWGLASDKLYDQRLHPFATEAEFIKQVQFMSPLGEALVGIVRAGLPVLRDRPGHPPERAYKLEAVIRKWLALEHEALERRTPQAPAPSTPRRL